MITIRQATSDDKKAWDNYVNQHAEHSPYHSFSWQYAVTAAYQHTSYYLIAEQVVDNCAQIVGVLPLIAFKKPFYLGKPSLCALPFCDIGGVLANSNDVAAQLISQSKIVGKNMQATCIEIRTNKTNQDIPEGQITEHAEKVSMLMPLSENSELLFNGFKSKLRSQIRKAEKNGLHYKIGSEQVMLEDFYQVFAHNMKALGSPVHAKHWFESLLEYYQKNMVISVVYKDELPIGAGIVLIAANNAAIPWASTKAEYNRLSPNMMLYWSLLKHLSDNGIRQFDFGRSSYGEGTYKFKQQWGAQPIPLSWQIIALQSTNKKTENSIHSNSNLRTIVENIWRKLPVNLTIFLGPKIRKYISL